MLIQESIYEEGNKLNLFRELLDNVSYRIIISTTDYAKSVANICSETKIPLSSAYKKINLLAKHGLIQIDRINIDSGGKRVVLYKSKVKRIQFGVEGDDISIRFENSLINKAFSFE